MSDELNKLQDILGYEFKDVDLLKMALRHASTTTERTQSNERLEFLGDRVLGLTLAEIVYVQFKDEDEGHLARRYAGLTSRVALARVADLLGLRQFIQIQSVDAQTEKRSHSSISADTLEALFGAMYLDGGLDPAQTFIAKHWANLIAEDLSAPKDAKTALQEWAQARSLGLPTYHIAKKTGPDHAPTFTMDVTVEGHPAQSAVGNSRRGAEQAAAQKLLSVLEKT